MQPTSKYASTGGDPQEPFSAFMCLSTIVAGLLLSWDPFLTRHWARVGSREYHTALIRSSLLRVDVHRPCRPSCCCLARIVNLACLFPRTLFSDLIFCPHRPCQTKKPIADLLSSAIIRKMKSNITYTLEWLMRRIANSFPVHKQYSID